MKIYFHGAAGDVTGSAYHVVTKDASILVDCGFFQGGKKRKLRTGAKRSWKVASSMRLCLTHGHLDHVGSFTATYPKRLQRTDLRNAADDRYCYAHPARIRLRCKRQDLKRENRTAYSRRPAAT